MASTSSLGLHAKKVYITGITGYLGTYIAHQLTRQFPKVQVMGTTRSLNNGLKLKQFKELVNPDITLL